jgi:hypothetical protein
MWSARRRELYKTGLSKSCSTSALSHIHLERADFVKSRCRPTIAPHKRWRCRGSGARGPPSVAHHRITTAPPGQRGFVELAFKRSRTVPCHLPPCWTCCILRPRKPEGELYTGIVRQIGAGISTEDPRRTLFIKYQPNTPGLYRAAYRY